MISDNTLAAVWSYRSPSVSPDGKARNRPDSRTRAGDNLAIHQALNLVRPGDVVEVDAAAISLEGWSVQS